MRRTVGIGGAAFVAMGAALVLSLPASAHTHSINASCSDNEMTLTINLTNYAKGSNGNVNTVTATDTPAGGTEITLVPSGTEFTTTFQQSFNNDSTPATGSDTVANTFVVKVVAWDDLKNGKSQGFSTTYTQTVQPCVTTTTTTAPPTTTTTAPPTTTKTTPPTTTWTKPGGSTTTTTALVGAATATTPAGTGSLPYTGVNAGFPIAIAGVLVVAGGGILFWLRMSSRRRKTS